MFEASNALAGVPNGIFGYISYDAVQLFETIKLTQNDEVTSHVPSIFYQAFRYVIAVNPINNQLHIVRNAYAGEKLNQNEFENI